MFRLQLIVGDQPGELRDGTEEARGYDPELDDVISLLRDICAALEESHGVTFWIEGFGQRPWPATVSTDLLVCLEQIPDLVHWLQRRASEVFELAFYEQTLMRYLYLRDGSDGITVACKSLWPKWQPDPEVEMIQRGDLSRMIQDLVRVFVEQAEKLTPHIVAHEWFGEWRRRAQEG